MAKRSFVNDGVPDLLDRVGDGLLRGRLKDDQVYAQYQHERLDLKHPRGGKARYLADPLMAEHQQYYAHMAENALEPDGLLQAMIDAVQSLNGSMSQQAPVDLNNLRRSGTESVWDNGQLAYRKPAEQKRLSREELNALRRGRRGRR